MANETEYANYVNPDVVVQAFVSPYFRAAAIMPNLVRAVNFADNTNSTKVAKEGAMSAAVVAESAAASVSEYTETYVQLTAQKIKVLHQLSEESQKFSRGNLQDIGIKQGRALAEKFDTDAIALMDGFSVTAGSTGVNNSVATMQDAAYKLELSNIPGPYVYLLHPTAINDVKAEIVSASTGLATVWANESVIGITGLQASVNGFVGSFFGVDVYRSTLTKSINSGADWACGCFSPEYALVAGYAGGFVTEVDVKDITYALQKVATTFYYDVKELNDLAGVKIIADQ